MDLLYKKHNFIVAIQLDLYSQLSWLFFGLKKNKKAVLHLWIGLLRLVISLAADQGV